MQTSGVTALPCIIDLAASIVFDATKPGMTVAFCASDAYRCLHAGAELCDRWSVGHRVRASAFLGQGGTIDLDVARPAPDAAADALRRDRAPLPPDISDTDRGAGKAAIGEDHVLTPQCGRAR